MDLSIEALRARWRERAETASYLMTSACCRLTARDRTATCPYHEPGTHEEIVAAHGLTDADLGPHHDGFGTPDTIDQFAEHG